MSHNTDWSRRLRRAAGEVGASRRQERVHVYFSAPLAGPLGRRRPSYGRAALPGRPRQSASKEGAYVQIILKDGFVLQGKVRREGKYEIDGQDVVFMPSGFFFLDDGPRRQYFSPSLMQQSPTEIKPPPDDFIYPKNTHIAVDAHSIPSVDEILDVSAFDDNWNRTVRFRTGLTKERTRHERLLALTPYYAHTQATQDYAWLTMYLTRELGPGVIRNLLSSHPDFTDDPKLNPADRAEHHLRYCNFMIQAGFDDEALVELARLDADNPAAALVKPQMATLRTSIQQLECSDKLETVKRMHNAGQFNAVRKKLANFDDKDADANTLNKCNELRDVYKTADKAMADVTRFFTDLPKGLGTDARDAALAEAAAALLAELQPDVLPRLDAFLGQARQAERQRAEGKTPTMGPAQLLSLAVTGWLGACPTRRPSAVSNSGTPASSCSSTSPLNRPRGRRCWMRTRTTAATRRRWTTSPGSSRCCRRRNRNRSTKSATRPWR